MVLNVRMNIFRRNADMYDRDKTNPTPFLRENLLVHLRGGADHEEDGFLLEIQSRLVVQKGKWSMRFERHCSKGGQRKL